MVAAILAITGVAANLVGLFTIIGASFGPIIGAMVADYLLSGKKWAGPRSGINFAGYGAWAVGFVIGGGLPAYFVGRVAMGLGSGSPPRGSGQPPNMSVGVSATWSVKFGARLARKRIRAPGLAISSTTAECRLEELYVGAVQPST